MGKYEGHSMGKRKGLLGWFFPGRPADAPEPTKAKKLPKGVEGHSLGKPNRKKGKK